MREWILAVIAGIACLMIPAGALFVATFGEKTAEKMIGEYDGNDMFSQYEADRGRLYDLEISFLESVEIGEPDLWERIPEHTRNEWDCVRVPSLDFLNFIYDTLDDECCMADVLDLDEWSVIRKIDKLRAEFEKKYGKR